MAITLAKDAAPVRLVNRAPILAIARISVSGAVVGSKVGL